MKKLLLYIYIIIIPYICISDNTKIIVGYTHALCTDATYGGVMKYENGKHSLDEHAWRLQLWAAANGGANYYRILPEAPFVSGITKRKVLTRFYYDLEKKKYNLFRWNPTYWKITKRMRDIAWFEYNMKFYCEVFDHCQQYDHIDPANKTSPFRKDNNIQGIETYQDNNNLAKRIVVKSIEVYGKTRIIYSLGNEIRFIKKNITGWAKTIFKTLLDNGIKPYNICIGSNGFNNYHSVMTGKDTFIPIKDDQYNFFVQLKTAFKEAAGTKIKRPLLIRPIHCAMQKNGGFIPIDPWGNKLGRKLFYAINEWSGFPNMICSDDGTRFTGKGKLVIIDGTHYRRPSKEQWFTTVTYCLGRNFKGGFEHLPLNRQNYNYTTIIFTAISKAYKNKYGEYPINFKKYKKPIKEIIEPDPEPEEIPDPEILDPVEPPEEEEPKKNNNIIYIAIAFILAVAAAIIKHGGKSNE